jgi:hypothetical protein
MTPCSMRSNGVCVLAVYSGLAGLPLLVTLAPARAYERPYDPYKWCAVGREATATLAPPTADS